MSGGDHAGVVGKELAHGFNVGGHVAVLRANNGGACPQDHVAGEQDSLFPVEDAEASQRVARRVNKLQRRAARRYILQSNKSNIYYSLLSVY